MSYRSYLKLTLLLSSTLLLQDSCTHAQHMTTSKATTRPTSTTSRSSTRPTSTITTRSTAQPASATTRSTAQGITVAATTTTTASTQPTVMKPKPASVMDIDAENTTSDTSNCELPASTIKNLLIQILIPALTFVMLAATVSIAVIMFMRKRIIQHNQDVSTKFAQQSITDECDVIEKPEWDASGVVPPTGTFKNAVMTMSTVDNEIYGV